MKSTICIFSRAVFLTLVMATVSVHVTRSQETGASTVARKIRTKTAPEYPQLARQLNVTGKVKLEITIAADGRVVSTRTIGGSPLLVAPAAEAVKKWRYEPASKESTEIVEITFADKN
jgi:TonB family protein